MKKSIITLIILCFVLIPNIFSQTITGTVTDETDGAPLPGVNILIKGTTQGTITDLDGKYSINLDSTNIILVFSYVGYETQEIEVSAQTEINVVLKPDQEELQEVVIVGYGVQKKTLVTGAAIKTSTNELNASNNKKSPKTWKRSNKSENAVRLSIGDDESDTLALIGIEMKVVVDGFRARILTNYFFYNDYSNYEGTFKIRMPAGASPYYFAFGSTVYLNKEDKEKVSFEDYYDLYLNDYIKNDSLHKLGNKLLSTKLKEWNQPKEAKVVPVQLAANAYYETVKGNVDPLLAEWGGADVFNCRVFPLEFDQVHRVVVGYDVNLTNVGNDKVFNLNIPKTSASIVVNLEVANLEGAENIISYKKGLIKENHQLKLHIENPDTNNIEIRYKQPGNILLVNNNEKYFASSLTIDLPKKEQKNTITNAVFALDVSASSNPDKFNVWLKLLKATLLNNPKKIKRFNVMFFNIETFWFKDNYIENTADNVAELMDYCSKLSLEGATDIGAAVNGVCKPDWLKRKSRKNVFLMSDGSVTWGKEELYSISAQVDKNSIIYVYNTGISGTDMNVLEHLARESGGNLFSVTGEDEIEAASKAFNYGAWRIKDLKLSGCSDLLIEGRPKCLFPGQNIIISGRGVPKSNLPLKLKLENGKEKQELNFAFNQRLGTKLAKRIYGQIAVNQIETFDFLATKDAIPYAVYYSVPGKTCSMLMLESESDYKDFKIILEKDSAFVSKTTVNKIVAGLVDDVKKSIGLEKDKLKTHLINLSNNDLVRFNLTESLTEMVENIPAKYFKIESPSIKSANKFKSIYSDSLLLELEKETPAYNIIMNTADSLEKEYGKFEVLKLLSTLIERNPGNANLAMDVAFYAMKLGLDAHAYFLLKKVIERSPHLPHAYHAIAQILIQKEKYDLALVYYEILMSTEWEDRYEDCKFIFGLDYYRFLEKIGNGNFHSRQKRFSQKRLKELHAYLDECDEIPIPLDSINSLIILSWNTDASHVDIYVKEPSGQERSYRKQNGEHSYVADTYTEGFGPDLYINDGMEKGMYKVEAEYYSDDESRKTTRNRVYVIAYQNWRKDDEKVYRNVVELNREEQREKVFMFTIN